MMRQTMVQLTDEMIERLDEEGARTGRSRSAVVREAVHEHFENSEEARLTRQIIEGYKRVPPGTPDSWGSMEAMAETSVIELMQRLHDEEAAEGRQEW